MRHIWILVLALCALSPAQSKPSSAMEDGAAFLSAGWQRLHRESRKVVKTWPQRIKELRLQISDLSAKGTKIANMKVQEKKALLAQLWQIRESLDLLTLMDPNVLKAVTGIDVKAVQQMWSQVRKIEPLLKNQA